MDSIGTPLYSRRKLHGEWKFPTGSLSSEIGPSVVVPCGVRLWLECPTCPVGSGLVLTGAECALLSLTTERTPTATPIRTMAKQDSNRIVLH